MKIDIKKIPAEISLLRHGECEVDFSKQNRKLKLSALGIEQAILARENIRRLVGNMATRYDILLTSPYERAIQTAETICEAGEWVVDDRLSERDWGLYGALNFTDRDRVFPFVKDNLQIDYYGYRLPGGENTEDVQKRQVDVVEHLNRLGAKTVFMSTHGGFMRAFQHLVEDLPINIDASSTIPADIRPCTLVTYRKDNLTLKKKVVNLTEENADSVKWITVV